MTTRRARVTDLVAEFHISDTTVRTYLRDAGIPRAADKTWPYADAAAAIRSRKDIAKTLGNRLHGRAGGIRTLHDLTGKAAEPEIDPFDETPSIRAAAPAAPALDEMRADFMTSKAAAEAERARKLKLVNDREEGRLIDRAAVEATVVSLVTTTRTALLSLGPRLAPLVTGETDPRTVRATIDAEVRRVLGSLADEGALLDEVFL